MIKFRKENNTFFITLYVPKFIKAIVMYFNLVRKYRAKVKTLNSIIELTERLNRESDILLNEMHMKSIQKDIEISMLTQDNSRLRCNTISSGFGGTTQHDPYDMRMRVAQAQAHAEQMHRMRTVSPMIVPIGTGLFRI